MSGEMTRVVKRIVQEPNELEKGREKWLPMERVVNVQLRRIDPRYEISNLIKRRDGSIEFEASIEFEEKHRKTHCADFFVIGVGEQRYRIYPGEILYSASCPKTN